MPRRPRIHLPGFPLHIIQRGNNRSPCFFSDDDCAAYLDWLRRAAEKHNCAIHAYVLMTNHVHLLLTPGLPGAISTLMQSLGRRYVQYVNHTYRRSGKEKGVRVNFRIAKRYGFKRKLTLTPFSWGREL